MPCTNYVQPADSPDRGLKSLYGFFDDALEEPAENEQYLIPANVKKLIPRVHKFHPPHTDHACKPAASVIPSAVHRRRALPHDMVDNLPEYPVCPKPGYQVYRDQDTYAHPSGRVKSVRTLTLNTLHNASWSPAISDKISGVKSQNSQAPRSIYARQRSNSRTRSSRKPAFAAQPGSPAMQEAVSATATRLRRIRDDGWSKETPRTGRVDTNRKRPETHATQPLSGDFTTQQPELLAFASLNRPPPTPFPPVDVGPIGRSAPSIPPPRTHIWDVQTRQTAGRPLKGHTDAVFSVESPPEGARIVSESRDRAICTRDANTGQMIGQSLKGHTHAVHSVACSPSGAHIVSGSDDRTIRIRDACTDRMVGQPLEGHTRMEVGPKKSVKDESHAERPDSCRDDAHREDVAPYSTRANSVDEHSLVSLSKPTIPPLNPQTRHSTFVSPTVPGLRGPNTLIASLHPAHQKPTSIKKEEASYEHGLGGPGNNPGAGRECKTLSLGYYPPSGRKPCSRGRIPQLSLFPCFTRKPGRATLPALFSKYLQSPGIPQNPPFFLFWRLIAKFAAKTKTYGNIPTGGQNFSGFPTGSDTPFTPSEHNWDLGLGDGSEIWSGQGPGNQLDSQYQTELEQDVLAYLARKYRQSLVPYPRDPIPNPPTGFVDVPPPPPIPLPSNPLPLPSSSALPVGAGLTPNSVINPPAPSQLSHSALDSYISYDNTETSTSSNYHPPIPYNLWGGEYSSISILPTLSNSPPNFNAASEGLDYESYGASWSSLLQSDPVDQHDSQPIPTSLNEFNDLVNDLGSGGSVFGHISADVSQHIQHPVTSAGVPYNSLEPPAGTPHAPMDSSIEQSSGAAPRVKPKAAIRRVPCLVEGCEKTFRRPHLLEDHVNLAHRGDRTHRCTSVGCNKSYSNQANMKRHYKQKHAAHNSS